MKTGANLNARDTTAKADLQQRLDEANLFRLASIVEFSGDAIIGKNLQSIITDWNRGAEKIFGYTSQEMVGTSISKLIPDDRLSDEVFILGKIKLGEPVEHFETQRRTKDGRLIDVWLTASPIKDATGKIIGAAKVARDITKSKQAEAALRESERFTQSTIDALSAQLCVLDETGTILATNEAWRSFTEANPPSALRAEKNANHLTMSDAATGAEAVTARAFAAGIRAVTSGAQASFALEYPYHSPTEKRWFVGRLTRFPGAGPVRVVVAHENITERKLAEEALHASETRLRTIVESEPECVKVVSVDGRLLDMNPAGLRMIEAERGDLVFGQPVRQLVHPDDYAAFAELHGRVARGESGNSNFASSASRARAGGWRQTRRPSAPQTALLLRC